MVVIAEKGRKGLGGGVACIVAEYPHPHCALPSARLPSPIRPSIQHTPRRVLLLLPPWRDVVPPRRAPATVTGTFEDQEAEDDDEPVTK